MFTLVQDRTKLGSELRDVVVKAIESAMDDNSCVVALEADLGAASRFTKIQKSHPDQFIQCGISEANMMGVAAGMSAEGFIPFVHTFAPFATRRAFDQIYLSGAYAHNTINIYGSDPGFCVGTNGGTHTSWEDMALMRSIPGCVVCDAADEVQLRWLINEFANSQGIHYIRANRKAVRNVYEPGSTFEMGKGNVLRTGDDVLIIVAGQLVSDALDAAESLSNQGIKATVIDMFCIKPLDKNLLLEHAVNKKAVVSFENHSIIGGLGEAVAAVLAENACGAKLIRHGIDERFGQVGSPDWLQSEFHLTSSDLESTIKHALG